MKNLKFIVAVMGITVATFGSMTVNAKGGTGAGKCIRTGQCGTTHAGQNIDGTWDDSGQQVTLELAP
jgi:hypothetical protein